MVRPNPVKFAGTINLPSLEYRRNKGNKIQSYKILNRIVRMKGKDYISLRSFQQPQKRAPLSEEPSDRESNGDAKFCPYEVLKKFHASAAVVVS